MYSVSRSEPFLVSGTRVSGRGITFEYLFLASAPGGKSSMRAGTTGTKANSSCRAAKSPTQFARPAKFTG